MPVTTVIAETASGYIYGLSSVSYETARSTSAGSSLNTLRVGQWEQGGSWSTKRTYLSFNTSAISGSVISARLYLKLVNDYSYTDFISLVYRRVWAETIAANREANYDLAYDGTAVLEGPFIDTSAGVSANVWYSIAVDPAGINKVGDTKYTIVSADDVSGTELVGTNAQAELWFYPANSAGNQPYLVVETQDQSWLSKTAGLEQIKQEPWHRAGPLSHSVVLRTLPGWLGGVRVTATDADGDVVVNLWDSPDSTTTDDIEVARLSLGKLAKDVREVTFPAPGIDLTNGLYVAITGTCTVEVWLR